MKRHRWAAVAAVAALLVAAGCSSGDPTAAAAPHQGVQVRNEGLAGIAGWEPVPNVCGLSSANPVVITNTYNQPQTLSLTVNDGLSAQVNFFPNWGAYGGSPMAQGCPGRTLYYSAPPGYTQDVTIPANSSGYFVLGMGGLDYNLAEVSNDLAIGAGGSSWYDFHLALNADESFKYVQLQYQNTGGTNPSQNTQTGLLNVVPCDPDSALNLSNPASPTPQTNSVISTYTSNAATANQVKYDSDVPICMAFLQPNSVG